MKGLPENSVDAIVTDPPYGIGFMGKEWDNFKPKEVEKAEERYPDDYPNPNLRGRRKASINSECKVAGSYDLSLTGNQKFQEWYCEIMKECLRVLKPGGHLLSFGGTRTYHRMAVAIEDAGFEIRDMIEWVYGSGFPKSHNIGKAVDKLQGNEREVVETNETIPDIRANNYS
ncbi:MAG: site-specific DNA-methyltransferase, partial [Bacteroidetes bacterium]|nr:site-specific DNA-methyltransferase [Bacteroidota bacterium]